VHRDSLAILSDGPVDELVRPLVQEGAVLLHANWSRAWVDLNRDPADLDHDAIIGLPAARSTRNSLRVRSGLGVVPIRLGERRIHGRDLTYEEVRARLEQVHAPYHRAIEEESRRLVARFGRMLLLDCHSMPGSGSGIDAVADIVLGDRHGRSCAATIVERIEASFRRAGFSVARNLPFAGGWITEHHGSPKRRRDAVQIELRRDLFLASDGRTITSAASRILLVLRDLVHSLAADLAAPREAGVDAAE
jgi:N-formylglutamate amidohydrolase